MALVAYLMESKNNVGPHLIIVPNAVVVNWKSEIKTWLPNINPVYYLGSKDVRNRIFQTEVSAGAANTAPAPLPVARRTSLSRGCSPCTEGYTYAANVWGLSLVQGPISVAPCQTLM
jgi:hypothetical protein